MTIRDYEVFTGHLTSYIKLPEEILLQTHLGRYLAKDKGLTVDISRRFKSGFRLGVFATKTDVSREDFGEGSFDKGIFFNIPIYGNFINYTWKPLTKDPGATLSRRTTLQGLLVRLRPIN